MDIERQRNHHIADCNEITRLRDENAAIIDHRDEKVDLLQQALRERDRYRKALERELRSMKRERASVGHICYSVGHICYPAPDCPYNACSRIRRIEEALGDDS